MIIVWRCAYSPLAGVFFVAADFGYPAAPGLSATRPPTGAAYRGRLPGAAYEATSRYATRGLVSYLACRAVSLPNSLDGTHPPP